jgi:protein O-GlcNAc transferase
VAAWSLLGQAASALSRNAEAVEAFSRAAALSPQDASAIANLSIAQMRAGDPHAAMDSGKRAIALNGLLPEAHASLGHALNILQRSEEAQAAFLRALALRSDFPDALVGLATALTDRGRPSAAAIALLRATELAPNSVGYKMALASAYLEVGDLEAAKTVRRKAAQAATGQRFHSNRLMCEQYDPDLDDRVAAADARAWGLREIAASPQVGAQTRRAPANSRKLRVGYVSADLYRHPVGWLGAAPISAHDHSQFHVTIYANQTCADELTAHVRRSVDAWVPILGLDDQDAATRIAQDEIDILVDLSGHTAGNRLGVFARRAAPVQVSWLGYFATTGLPTIDYALLDDAHLIPGAESLFVESVIRLQGCRFCYQPPAYAPDVAPPPSLATRRITFGSFNRSAKINSRVLDLRSRLLREVQNSDLLLKWRSFNDPWVQRRLRAEFERRGVRPDRIRFDGHTSHPEMIAQYGEVDLALDPFPFSGGLTSCEALWMGVPVLTLPGSRPVSRQTHSVLLTIGRGEFSAVDEENYVRTAAQLANDGCRLGQLRDQLRVDMMNSRLCDPKAFARQLESIYTALAQQI